MKKKAKKCHFMQGWGTYTNETFVCVGLDNKEIVSGLKKIGANDLCELVESYLKDTPTGLVGGEHNGFVWEHDGKTILWLKDVPNNIQNTSVLVHELSHLIDKIFGRKALLEETEAKAYQFEYLFREIMKKLK